MAIVPKKDEPKGKGQSGGDQYGRNQGGGFNPFSFLAPVLLKGIGGSGGDGGAGGDGGGGGGGWGWGDWTKLGLSAINTYGGLKGGRSQQEKTLQAIATAPFDHPYSQNVLPPFLRLGATGDFMNQGIQNLGELITNPGMLSSTISDAIRQRVAMESERTGAEFRGIKANQAGAAARGNLPVSIKNALSSALDVAQSRAQRDIRREALSDSDQLRRADANLVFPLIDAMLQFFSVGRGQAITGLGQTSELAATRDMNNQAAMLALAGSLLSDLPNTDKQT